MPNVSIVRATIIISSLNNEKVKVKSIYLYYALRYKVQNILHSCTRCVGGLIRVQSLMSFNFVSFSGGDQRLLMEISWEHMVALASLVEG